jgi:hypothetical protein
MLVDTFRMQIDLDPSLARSAAEIAELKAADAASKIVAVVGNSHARRLAGALEDGGISITMVTDRSWKLTKDNIKQATDELVGLELKPDLIIVQALDNNTYFVSKEDGSLSVPTKGPDGKFHVDGDLRVATKDQTIILLKILRPLLDAVPDVEKILILPLP